MRQMPLSWIMETVFQNVEHGLFDGILPCFAVLFAIVVPTDNAFQLQEMVFWQHCQSVFAEISDNHGLDTLYGLCMYGISL